ncbi:hypothetical protein B7463_g6832, partial [Scytalidium lignicola]
MPPNLLADIPRELRDKIYLYTLAAPSGSDAVPLFPQTFVRPDPRFRRRHFNPTTATATNENNVTISLSLLLTCKQIRKECKDLIWLHNGLWVPRDGKCELQGKFEHYAGLQLFQQIRNIIIRLELLDWDELAWLCQSLHPFIALVNEGNLKSIQLLAKTDRKTPMQDFNYLGNLRRDWECIDGRWYRAAQISGQQARYHKKFVINTGWPRFFQEGKQEWVRDLLVNEMTGMDRLLEELNGMFRGEVYVNGFLCFQNGSRTRKAIRWNPKEGNIEIRPERRLHEENNEENAVGT